MNELYHHGVRRQKWGVRRYQDKDGHLTSEGHKRAVRRLMSDEKAYAIYLKVKGSKEKKERKEAATNFVDIYSAQTALQPSKVSSGMDYVLQSQIISLAVGREFENYGINDEYNDIFEDYLDRLEAYEETDADDNESDDISRPSTVKTTHQNVSASVSKPTHSSASLHTTNNSSSLRTPRRSTSKRKKPILSSNNLRGRTIRK